MKFSSASKVAALGLVMALLAGCGQSLSLASVDQAGARALGAKGFGGKGHPGKGHPGGLFGFPGVDLTAEQQTQLKAIADKYKPQAPTGEKPGNQVKALLEAETVDAAALKAALEAQPAAPDHLAFLQEARAILTDAQRATAVEKLKAQTFPAAPAPRPTPSAEDRQKQVDQLAEKLKLTAEQKAAYQAFQAKQEANRPAHAPHDPAAHRDALVAFLESGDTSKLAALQPAADRPAFPVDEFVALAVSLNVEQRKALLSRPFGGHGGKGGHRGHGGPKGHGGKGMKKR